MKISYKHAVGLLVSLVLSQMTLAGETGAKPQQGSERTAASDITKFQEEAQRIREKYKNDLPRLTEELRALNQKRAAELGLGDELKNRERLREKYGPVMEGFEVDAEGFKLGKTIDAKAWSAYAENVQGITVVHFFLDKRRYKESQPQDFSVQLRQKGATAAEEDLLARGLDVQGAFRVTLSYAQAKGGVYVVSMNIPEKDKERLVLQVTANIEPGWGTLANFPLQKLEAVK